MSSPPKKGKRKMSMEAAEMIIKAIQMQTILMIVMSMMIAIVIVNSMRL